MKAIILAAGKGTRLAELNLVHKSFAMVNKKHVINYSLDLASLSGGGISEIIIVVGHNAQALKDHLGTEYNGLPITYVHQHELKGIAHAVLISKEALDDDFVMFLADEVYFNPRLIEMIQFFRNHKLNCSAGAIVDGEDHSGKPIAYDVDDECRIIGVTEKPKEYHNSYRGIGCCIFSKAALEVLSELEPNSIRGELEMGDWIRLISQKLGETKIFDFADAYVNVNYVQDLEKANELLAGN